MGRPLNTLSESALIITLIVWTTYCMAGGGVSQPLELLEIGNNFSAAVNRDAITAAAFEARFSINRSSLDIYPATPGTAADAAARVAQIIDPGTDNGAAAHTLRPPITDRGTAVGAEGIGIRDGFSEIIDPGTDTSAAAHASGAAAHKGPSEIIDPGTDTGAAAHMSRPPPITDGGTDDTGAAALPRAALASGASPLNFMDLDSGLRDCDIPFDKLKIKSPFCKKASYTNGRRCERYSHSQFPEVVRVTVINANGSQDICSGTMIAADWVITAAHCFVGNTAMAERKDLNWTPSIPDSLFVKTLVEANNAKMLPGDQQRRIADRVIVYGQYGGQKSRYQNDITLVHLPNPYPSESMQPAILANENQFSSFTTLAGYGYSNADGGIFGQFGLTWPVPIERNAGELSFSPQNGGKIKSGFCQGDSGGPVFAGRYRGCKPIDAAPESRPRLLEGSISFNDLGKPDGTSEAQRASAACRNADEMAMQDLTISSRRQWICHITGNSAGGCK
jgi:Trypsin